MKKGKTGLGIVIVRIVVAALVLALIVLILMMTVFKVPSTKKAYNSLNEAFAPEGTITSMTKELDDFPEFNAEYGKYIVVFKQELLNLQASYPKLYYVQDSDDEQMNAVTTKLEEVKNALQEATGLIKDVNKGKQTNSNLDVNAYVQSLKPKITNALDKVTDLNCDLQEFLTANYYGGAYFEQTFLNKLQSFVAKQFYVFANADYNSSESVEIYNFYLRLLNGFTKTDELGVTDIAKVKELNSVLKVLPSVNLFKIVDNVSTYKKANEKDVDLTAKIAQVENYINGISSDFNLSDIANAKEAK